MDGQASDPAEADNLLAAGINHFKQISSESDGDVLSFSPVQDPSGGLLKSGRVLFTGWSSTVLVCDNQLIGRGHQKFNITLEPGLGDSLIEAFGDHDGMQGCLDTLGRLYLMRLFSPTYAPTLECQSAESSPSIGHIAIAGNEQVAITFKQAPAGRLCHTLQFAKLSEFLAWFKDPSAVELDTNKQHFMMQGRPIQLLANTATFVLLMEGGEVYTWGDPRYRSLGRSITGEDAAPADRPGQVDALAGMKMKKIACGGWMCAALSEDQVLYIWGTGTPGQDRTIKDLREADAGSIICVGLMDEREPLDVIDVGVGDNHVVAIGDDAGQRQLWVVGENNNGQLGVNSERVWSNGQWRAMEDAEDSRFSPEGIQGWLDDWREVESLQDYEVRQVVCGPLCTFITAGTRPS